MPLHNASSRDDLPQYENPHKQEAVRFLAADIEEQQLIDGMVDVDRLEAWLQVVDRFEDKDGVGDALRERRAQLLDELDQQAQFEPASQTDAGQQAVTDGGAEIVEETDEDSTDDGWEPRDGQSVREYGTEEAYQNELRSARSLAEEYDGASNVVAALERERDRDEWRPHVAQALQERLEVLE